MNNAKRMMAVIAASGLALGSMPGIANAQSEGLLDLDLGVNVGDSVEVGVGLGLGSLGLEEADLSEFPDLAGSLGAATGATGSDDLDTGSEELDDDVIGDLIEAGSAGGSGSGEGSTGSGEGEEGDTGSANGGSGSASNEGEEGDEGDIPSGSLGSVTDALGSSEEGEEGEEPASSLEDIFSGSASAEDGEDGEDGEDATGSSDIDAETLLTLGSLAGAGIAVGIAVNGGVNLPPLPAIDFGVVCTLPQEGIDFLKGNGSMEQDECEPDAQN